MFVKSLDTRWLEGVNVSFQLAPHDALMPAVSQGGMAMCCHNKSSQKKSSALQTWWQLEKLLATLRAILLLLFAFINLEIQQHNNNQRVKLLQLMKSMSHFDMKQRDQCQYKDKTKSSQKCSETPKLLLTNCWD